MKIREYFISVKTQLEEYNQQLREQLGEAQLEISEKTNKIDELRRSGTERQAEIDRLEQEKAEIQYRADDLHSRFQLLKQKYEGPDVLTYRIPRIDPEFFKQIERSSQKLRTALSHTITTDFSELSRALGRQATVMDALGTLKDADTEESCEDSPPDENSEETDKD